MTKNNLPHKVIVAMIMLILSLIILILDILAKNYYGITIYHSGEITVNKGTITLNKILRLQPSQNPIRIFVTTHCSKGNQSIGLCNLEAESGGSVNYWLKLTNLVTDKSENLSENDKVTHIEGSGINKKEILGTYTVSQEGQYKLDIKASIYPNEQDIIQISDIAYEIKSNVYNPIIPSLIWLILTFTNSAYLITYFSLRTYNPMLFKKHFG